MATERPILLAFNRGIVDRLALARIDLKRMALSAAVQTNWMPRVLGSMMLRPGLGYTGTTRNNAQAKHFPFVFSTSDIALLELTDSVLRVKIAETPITRPAVTAAVSNGTFDTDLTGWTDADESGATSSWLTGGTMSLVGTRFNAAIRRQQVTVSETGTEHALRVTIARGPVTIKIGSTSGGDDYIAETELKTGTHSLAFTPTGDFWIELSARRECTALVDSIAVEGAGAMELPTPWTTASLSKVRFDQSADVLFVACDGFQQRRIERHGARSWSVVLYAPEDGPFRVQNTSTIRLTPSAISGDITLTASRASFKSTHVGALYRLTSIGQQVSLAVTAENQFSDPIRVTGVGTARQFSIAITGTWAGTVRLQRSVGDVGAWSDVSGQSWIANVSTTYSDGLDNQIIYYRIGIKTGEYTSGTATVSLTYASGSLDGIVRITGFTSATSVSAQVLTALGGTTGTETWSEGEWSDYRGWPTATVLFEGRLWWLGRGKYWGSISDAYESFDDTQEGDAGPISRAIGSGPVDVINWALGLERLIGGTQGAEVAARSSSFDEPLTPTNFNLKDASTQGSAAVAAVKIDTKGMYVQRGGRAVHQLAYDFGVNDYASTDVSVIVPSLLSPGIVALAVQRKPDTRVHCVLADGTVAVLIYDPAENTSCWILVETSGADGLVEDVVVLPDDIEDRVYYAVKRTINGGTVRYLERWAREDECKGATLVRLADSFIVYSGAATTTIGGLSTLEGTNVVCWGDGKCFANADGSIHSFTVSGGAITLPSAVSNAVVGLSYSAQFQSAKLAYAAQQGTPLTRKKTINALGLILADAHPRGLEVGSDFSIMDNLPLVIEGRAVDPDAMHADLDLDATTFPGTWDTDARLCLRATAPRPCTVLAAVPQVQTDG